MQSPAVRPHTQGTCHSTICHLRAASGSQLPSLARRPAARRLLPLAVLVPLLISGCGRSVPLGQVDGTVRLDGQPIGQVMVVFIPEDPRLPQSMGITDERGQFKLRCGKQGAGGAIGNHRVTLVDAAAAPATKGAMRNRPRGALPPTSRIPAIYNRADSTPLREAIAAGSQAIAIEIQSAKKPA